jgi:hypothetical protein
MNQDTLASTAAQFSEQLRELSVVINKDISQVFRATTLRVFGNIVRRSPVLTGAYRGSHGIANIEPGGSEGINVGDKKTLKSVPAATAKGWSWSVGDGDIWIYNNLPYAERLENGWSKQAPEGIYGLALQEFIAFMSSEIAKAQTLVGD